MSARKKGDVLISALRTAWSPSRRIAFKFLWNFCFCRSDSADYTPARLVPRRLGLAPAPRPPQHSTRRGRWPAGLGSAADAAHDCSLGAQNLFGSESLSSPELQLSHLHTHNKTKKKRLHTSKSHRPENPRPRSPYAAAAATPAPVRSQNVSFCEPEGGVSPSPWSGTFRATRSRCSGAAGKRSQRPLVTGLAAGMRR